MKLLYKIIILAVSFHFMVLIVNSLGAFPITLYSDADVEDIAGISSPADALGYFFSLPENLPIPEEITTFTIGFVVICFITIGAAIAIFTHSWAPVVITIIGTSFIPMLIKSWSFFQKVFTNWDTPSLMYLGILIGFLVLLIGLFTIMETPTHGRSG